MLAFPLAALAACGDHLTDPDDLLESEEAEAVLRSAGSLPLLPAFLDAADGPDATGAPLPERERTSLVRARERWDAGAAVSDSRGAARRRLAIGYALPVLLEVVPPEEWGESREQIDAWVTTARSMLEHLTIPEVENRLKAAEAHLARSDEALSGRSRLHYLLLAGSELVETTPRSVARTLSRQARSALQRATSTPGPTLPEATLRRAERLSDWSIRAVEEGNYLRAIQRAYYALQLLESP